MSEMSCKPVYSLENLDCLLAFLYLAQLIKLEFPSHFMKIIEDPVLLAGIPIGAYALYSDEDKSSKNEEIDKALRAIVTNENAKRQSRFSRLYTGLQDISDIADQFDSKHYFYFIEYDPVLTWREFGKLLESWKNLENASGKSGCLQPFIGSVESTQHLFDFLVKHHNNILSEVVNTDSEDDQKEKIKEAQTTLELIQFIVENEKVFSGEHPRLGPDQFYNFFAQALRWSPFKTRVYKTHRNAERTTLNTIVSLSRKQHHGFLEKLKENDLEMDYIEPSDEFKLFQKELINTLTN